MKISPLSADVEWDQSIIVTGFIGIIMGAITIGVIAIIMWICVFAGGILL